MIEQGAHIVGQRGNREIAGVGRDWRAGLAVTSQIGQQHAIAERGKIGGIGVELAAASGKAMAEHDGLPVSRTEDPITEARAIGGGIMLVHAISRP